MLDPLMVRLIAAPINRLGALTAKAGVSANSVTVTGFVIGMLAAPALALDAPLLALVFIAANRIADGLDGAIARINGKTEFGAYLDIVLDFIFYGAVVLGFALRSPDDALIAAALILSFIGTGASFLAYAIVAAKTGIETDARGEKSFFYSGGLAEGTETIAFFAIICIWPDWFTPAAVVFMVMCWITVAKRIYQAWSAFGETDTR